MSSDETPRLVVQRATISDAERRNDQASSTRLVEQQRGFISSVAQNIAPGVGNAIGAGGVGGVAYGAKKGWDKLTGGGGKPPSPPADK
jgi:hypothetical protein